MIRFLAFCLLICALGGCGSKREEVSHREEQSKTVAVTQTKTERNAYAPDGTPYVEITLTTTTVDSETRAKADTRLTSETTIKLPDVSAGIKIIGGAVAGSNPILASALAVFTALSTAWAAHATAKANNERKRADEHKADAVEGWEKADRYAKALPPDAPV